MRSFKIAKVFIIVFIGLGLAFWLWPSILIRSVWLVAFWTSLTASLWVALASLPHLFLGYLTMPASRGTVFRRLVLVDFGSESSSTRRFISSIPLSLIFLGVAWSVGLLTYAIVLVAFFLSTEINYLVERLTPLLVLYLGSSDPHDSQRSSSLIAATLYPRLRRLVTILRPTERSIAPSFTRYTSYRTHDDLWVTMLDELLELTRIIVIDLRTPTAALSFELNRVLEKRLAYKTLVLVDSRQVDKIKPVLSEITVNGGVCLTDYSLLVNLLYMFCNPRMRLPTSGLTMHSLVDDIRSVNPKIEIPVWDDSE